MLPRVEAPIARAPRREVDPIDRAWALLPALLPPIHALSSGLSMPDLAYQIRLGQLMRSTGSIPTVDTFTFTMTGQEWIDQQWIGQLVLEGVYRLGGWAGLGVLHAVLIGLTFWIVAAAGRAAGASARTSCLLAIGAYVVAAPNLAMRPQLLALPLFATACLLVAGRTRHPQRLWTVPLLAIVVANLHGSFVLFPLLLALAWLDDVLEKRPGRRHVLVVAGVTLLTTLLNPRGIEIWRYAYELSTNRVIRERITEWAPTTMADAAGWLMVSSALAIAIYTSRRARPVPWGVVITLSVFFMMAMASQRAILWWSVVFPWLVAGSLQPTAVNRTEHRSSVVPALVIVAIPALVIVALLPWWRPGAYEDELRYAPHGITEAAARLPAGSRILAYQPWGSWFEFALPDLPVFVDSRIELYPERIWDDYAAVADAKARWRDTLERWEPDAIAADDEWDILPLLRADPAWRVAYEDDDGVLFVRG